MVWTPPHNDCSFFEKMDTSYAMIKCQKYEKIYVLKVRKEKENAVGEKKKLFPPFNFSKLWNIFIFIFFSVWHRWPPSEHHMYECQSCL